AGRLQMSARVITNPDVLPRGRDDERFDALPHFAIADGAPGRIDVAEPSERADASDARRTHVVDVPQAGDLCGLDGRQRRLAPDECSDAAELPLRPVVGGLQLTPGFWQRVPHWPVAPAKSLPHEFARQITSLHRPGVQCRDRECVLRQKPLGRRKDGRDRRMTRGGCPDRSPKASRYEKTFWNRVTIATA